MKENEGSFIKRCWGNEPQIINKEGKHFGYVKWNTVYSMMPMLVEIKRMKNAVLATSYYKLNPKIEDRRDRFGE